MTTKVRKWYSSSRPDIVQCPVVMASPRIGPHQCEMTAEYPHDHPVEARCMAAKFLKHIGDRPANRHAIYAHCDRVEHGEEGHHFVDPYGRTV